MKKILLTGAALMILVVPASGATTQRTVSREYSAPDGFNTGVIEGHAAYAAWSVGLERHSFTAISGEKKVRFSILDESGLPARGSVYSDRNSDGIDIEEIGDFCSISDPITVRPHESFVVFVISGRCPDGTTLSAPSQGTIVATFTS